jgi:hypothetical protein
MWSSKGPLTNHTGAAGLKLQAIEAAGMTALITKLPANERYTYVFQGNSQVLDHIMTSASLVTDAELDVLHVNADFSEQASDHDPVLARLNCEWQQNPDSILMDSWQHNSDSIATLSSSNTVSLTCRWCV